MVRLFISFIFFLILSSQAWATTYYVRLGGGTSTTDNSGNGINGTFESSGQRHMKTNHPSLYTFMITWILILPNLGHADDTLKLGRDCYIKDGHKFCHYYTYGCVKFCKDGDDGNS